MSVFHHSGRPHGDRSAGKIELELQAGADQRPHAQQSSVEFRVGTRHALIAKHNPRPQIKPEGRMMTVACEPDIRAADGHLQDPGSGRRSERDRSITIDVRIESRALQMMAPGEAITGEPRIQDPGLRLGSGQRRGRWGGKQDGKPDGPMFGRRSASFGRASGEGGQDDRSTDVTASLLATEKIPDRTGAEDDIGLRLDAADEELAILQPALAALAVHLVLRRREADPT